MGKQLREHFNQQKPSHSKHISNCFDNPNTQLRPTFGLFQNSYLQIPSMLVVSWNSCHCCGDLTNYHFDSTVLPLVTNTNLACERPWHSAHGSLARTSGSWRPLHDRLESAPWIRDTEQCKCENTHLFITNYTGWVAEDMLHSHLVICLSSWQLKESFTHSIHHDSSFIFNPPMFT